jgi:ABC-type glycerol-3-phosphate transport system substrate-binding protein
MDTRAETTFLFTRMITSLDRSRSSKGEYLVANTRISRRAFFLATMAAGSVVLVVACSAPAAAPTQAPAAAPTQAPAAAPTQAPAATQATGSTPSAVATQPSKATGEVLFWGPSQDWGEFMRDEFNKAQPDIKLTWQLGEYDANTKTMASLAAGTPPSISYLGRWQGPDLAVRNAIRALDDYIKSARTFKWEDIWPRMQKDSTTWGKKWVVPYATDTRALFFNKDIFTEVGLDPAKPPQTWKDVEDYSLKILKRDSAGRLTRIGFTPTFGNPPTSLLFFSVLWAMGGDYVTEDLTKVAYQQKGLDAMTYIKKLMDMQGGYEKASAFTTALSPGTGLDAFSTGNVGLAMNGQWTLAGYDKYSPNLKYDMVPGPIFPQFNINTNYDGGGGLYYFKQGKNFDGAWAFTEFAMEPTFYLKWSEKSNALAARADVGNEWAKGDKRRAVFAATAGTCRWCPVVVGLLEIGTNLSNTFDEIMFGKTPVDKGLAAMADTDQQILDRFNSFPVPAG